jgi:uncharacterized YigZ family protein
MTADGILITLETPNRLEEEIKKSRFISCVTRARSPEEAFDFLSAIKEPKATHHCWAYRIGELYRFSDDGEPGGTAGRPILAAIEGQGLDEVMAVVIRYYGGIKLGAGGLVRAYGNTTSECLRTAKRLEIRPTLMATLEAPFDLTGTIYQLLDRHPVEKLSEKYTEHGLTLHIKMETSVYDAFCLALRDATRGKVVPELV